MESQNRFLKIHPHTRMTLRKMYDLDKPERLKEALDILEKWLNQQNHFVKRDFSSQYLENSLLAGKGSIEITKSRLDRLCTLRTLVPQFFGSFNVIKDFTQDLQVLYSSVLPKQTKDFYRVYMFKCIGKTFTAGQVLSYYRSIICMMEYFKAHDCNDGYIIILDFSDADLKGVIKVLSPSELGQLLSILQQGFGARFRGIHMVSNSKLIDFIISLFKQFLSDKLSKRIYTHISIEELYDFVPKEMLPKDYGGNENSLIELQEDFFKVLSTEENIKYLEEMSHAVTDEKVRQTDVFNEQYIGMPGTFRTLSVD